LGVLPGVQTYAAHETTGSALRPIEALRFRPWTSHCSAKGSLADRNDVPDHFFIGGTIGDEEWHLLRPFADGAFPIDMPYFDVDPRKLSSSI
jgi:hypothetical protein